ncbi:nucleotidyl transferase AbiEii/AbiGii toxin family protein [Actinomadura chokoriensis]|uniref:Nucleotidyl transferase AbiEii/AbiGii toxin family protein n=1 Tax=Actinomadura chokoriensis TaxID=454156 RepID=A0ABV4R281_9ACTN
MDRFQHRLAGIALEVVGDRGFVLGGGHAVQLHGMGTRPSEDIDLFSSQRGSPEQVADDVIAAYTQQGLRVEVARRTPDLVQMTVADSNGHACKVDLGVFWQAHAR